MGIDAWTADKPNASGWYWWRNKKLHFGEQICRLKFYKNKLFVYFMEGERYDLDIMKDGEWLGPITPDSYQHGRVAGLGDVKRYVERQIKIGEDFIGGPDPNIQRRVALDEVIEYCDRQLAQAAQDAKGVGDGLHTDSTENC